MPVSSNIVYSLIVYTHRFEEELDSISSKQFERDRYVRVIESVTETSLKRDSSEGVQQRSESKESTRLHDIARKVTPCLVNPLRQHFRDLLPRQARNVGGAAATNGAMWLGNKKTHGKENVQARTTERERRRRRGQPGMAGTDRNVGRQRKGAAASLRHVKVRKRPYAIKRTYIRQQPVASQAAYQSR